MDTVRLARDFGTVRELYPDGVDSLWDLPHPLFDAIRMASIFLSFEELPKDEQPPRRIWDDGDKLKEWFEEVERKRKAKYDSDGAISDRPIEDPVENAAGLVVG